MSNINLGTNAIERLGAMFLAGLQRLYAAHTEKVQMRFAPQPIRCDRGIKQRSYLG